MSALVIAGVLLLGAQGGGEKEPVDLAAQMRHKDARIRLQAVEIAGKRGTSLPPAAVRALAQCLDDADAKIRRAAAKAVGDLGPYAREWGGGPKVGEALGKLLTDKSDLVRRAAVWAYGQVGIDTQEELLTITSAFKDRVVEVRGLALQSAGQYLYEDTPAEWRLAAETEMAALLGDADARVQKIAGEQLLAAGAEVVPVLTKVLETGKASAKVWAAIVLGELGTVASEALPALQKAMSEVPADRRATIQQAIKKIQP